MTIASLIIDIAANSAQVVTEMQRVNSTIEGVSGIATKAAASLAGMFTLGAITSAINKVGEWGGAIDAMSKRLDISVESVQRLQFAAAQSETSFTAVARAVEFFSRNLVAGKLDFELRNIGLSAEALKKLDMDAAFLEVAKAINALPDPTMRTEAAFKLWSRSGTELLQMLPTLIADMERAPVASERLVKASEELGDTWDKLKGIGIIALAAVVVGWKEGLEELMTPITVVRGMFADLGSTLDELGPKVKGRLADFRDLATGALPAMTTSMADLDKQARQLDEQIKKNNETWKKQRETLDKNLEAHRAFTNWIGEREIEAFAAHQEAAEAAMTAEVEAAIAAGHAWDGYHKQLQAALDRSEEAWRNYNNEVGIRLMEQDKAIMESTRTWGEMFGDFFNQVDQMFAGGRMRAVVSTFQSIWKAGQGGMKSIGALMLTDFTGVVSGIMAGIQLISAAWQGLKRLFGGGEEGVVVNPMRDTFLSQFGPGGTGPGSGFHNLAAMLTAFGAGDGGGGLFSAMTSADTEAKFRSAAQAIVDFITGAGGQASMNFHTGGMVPGTGVVNARLLGGERVQSRDEVGAWGAMLTELRGLRADFMTQRELMLLAARDEAMFARGRA